MTPKERLEAKKREHYMQGSISSNPKASQGGMSRSNECSQGNPMVMQDRQVMDRYKQINQQMVANDPIKKGGGRGASMGMGGGGGGAMGGGGMSGGDMGGGGAMGGGGGGAQDGMVKKRGGVAMNL